ncbi:MAG: hypothetical protein GXP29_11485 [Planctomycetes bacterium]|nr:hypothetical protein [Planctomycetota bacterium]
MKRRIRKRRVLKWIGVGLCFVLGAGWILSSSKGVWYAGSEWSIACIGGSLGIGFGDFRFQLWNLGELTTEGEWLVDEFGGVQFWWPSIQQVYGPTDVMFFFPIWMFLLSTTIATMWLWRSDRRPKSGRVNCGYNLTGNVSGVCPECGRAITAADQA